MTAAVPLQRAHARAILASLLFLLAMPGLLSLLAARLPGVVTPASGIPAWPLAPLTQAAQALVLAGWVGLALLALLCLAATQGRGWRLASLALARRLLPVMGVAGLAAQLGLMAWMAMWWLAHAVGVAPGKLLVALAGMGLLALWPLGRLLWSPRHSPSLCQGHWLTPDQAPAFWTRLKDLAAALGTTPPERVLLTVADSIHVTESPVQVGSEVFRGRLLVLSLPLLRRLEMEEADAVLVHELAHFLQHDTAYAAAMGPARRRFEARHARMAAPGGSRIVCHLMTVYRMAFEWRESGASRRRELAADRLAIRHVSPYALVNALVKMVAYARYRQLVGQGLLAQQARHQDRRGLGERVAEGLDAYVGSEAFGRALRESPWPHPVDEHPTLQQRMKAAGLELSEDTCRRVLRRPVVDSWAASFEGHQAVEDALWQAAGLEGTAGAGAGEGRRFIGQPAPALRFPLPDGSELSLDAQGIVLPGEAGVLGWDEVAALDYRTGWWSDQLRLVHVAGHARGPRTVARLKGMRAQREAFLEALNHHWQRESLARRRRPGAAAR